MAKKGKEKAIERFVSEKRDVAVTKAAAKEDGKVTKQERKDIRKEKKEFKEARKDLKQKYGKGAVKEAKEEYNKRYPKKPIGSDPFNESDASDVVSNSRVWGNSYIQELYGLGMDEVGSKEQEQYAINLYRNFEASVDSLVANNNIGEIDQIPTTLAVSVLYQDDDKRVDYDSLVGIQDIDDIIVAPPRNRSESEFNTSYLFGAATPTGFVENQVRSNPDGTARYDMKLSLPDVNGVVDYRVDILEVQ